MAEDMTERIEVLADLVTMLGETVSGLRSHLVKQGFSEQVAEMMCLEFYHHLVHKIFEEKP